MKTNTIHVILTAVFVGVITLIATSKSAVDFSFLASAVSYTAVAIIAAVAGVDYRKNTKNYAAR
ncbi:MAG: hypothetical protein PSW75_10075 [bacterium]|nr:hypothetical protein [bacterium]MDI1334803.1 hypothetical protein [Lacunisphaera sp.]